jgi:hypothetical protein
MVLLRRLRLQVAFALALTLMACASHPATETSVFDTLARGSPAQMRPAGCNPQFEIKSCQSSTGMRGDESCTCIPRQALSGFN